MSSARSEAVQQRLRALFESGSMAGVPDAQLVERFAAKRDSVAESAFAILVARHGPMVLGVCRHLLRDVHSADDAFQAVFLVLARRAGSIRQPDLLGPWLHGVATRIARKARAQASRREQCEVEMNNIESVGPEADANSFAGDDAAVLHEEIGRLPERYRRAVVLCHFEGLTHGEAARRLGCAPGTVGSLVSRARELLRTRLGRRGLTASSFAMAVALEPKVVTAAVPSALERATVRAALSFASKRAVVAGIVSKSVVELACGALKTMTLNKAAITGAFVIVLGFAAAAGGLAAGMSREPARARHEVRQQARSGPEKMPAPELPGAVTQPPAWLKQAAPFDFAAFFDAPPPHENAAPRYLEALFEFGPQVEVCFPEGSDRQSRKQAVEQRLGRFQPVFQAWSKDPLAVSAASIDAVVSEFDTGFRKLDWAQQRPRCVFQSNLGATARIPHVQTAGNVARVARLKVHRELERGELDAALRDLARLLRLCRDLLPRGVMIAGMVSSSIDRAAIGNVVVPILKAPGLTVNHCDELLALLRQHESKSRDPYSEGLQADFISSCATLHAFVFEQNRLRRDFASLDNPAGPSIVAAIAEPVMFAALAPNAAIPKAAGGGKNRPPAQRIVPLQNIDGLDALMALTTPDELRAQLSKIKEVYAPLLDVTNSSFQERIRKSNERPRSLDATDIHTRVTRGLVSSAFQAFTKELARQKASGRVAQGLIAVRRWQLAHDGEVPPSLEACAKEAGLPDVPIDPYDSRPIRFAVVDGQPTVYSVGQDGLDDGGKIDNARTPDSGDLVFRLSKP